MRKKKTEDAQATAASELRQALDILEKEKDISRDILLDAIENSLMIACKSNYGKTENIHCDLNREDCSFFLYAEKTVVQDVTDPLTEISPDDAMAIKPSVSVGDTVKVELKSQNFGRIAAQSAKNVILQKIREEERNAVYNEFIGKEHEVITGVVQRFIGKNISVNLGHADAFLSENEQVAGEILNPNDHVKVYVLEVRNSSKGPRILVSRTHPELVRRLFETEVAEVSDGTVEIKGISREAGSRTKMAVWSNNPDVDAVGACVGISGARVNAVVEELGGEKIDIINWDENPAIFIENALSPAKVVSVIVDGDEKTAKVVVPDYQLSLAIGREGQNARLAARLTGFKIDIKSETQAKDAPGFRMEDYLSDEDDEYEDDEYTEDGEFTEESEEVSEDAVEEIVDDEISAEESDADNEEAVEETEE